MFPNFLDTESSIEVLKEKSVELLEKLTPLLSSRFRNLDSHLQVKILKLELDSNEERNQVIDLIYASSYFTQILPHVFENETKGILMNIIHNKIDSTPAAYDRWNQRQAQARNLLKKLSETNSCSLQ